MVHGPGNEQAVLRIGVGDEAEGADFVPMANEQRMDSLVGLDRSVSDKDPDWRICKRNIYLWRPESYIVVRAVCEHT